MKKQIIYSILSLSFLAACSTMEDEGSFTTQSIEKGENVLILEISASDFVVDGRTNTRATDDGKYTSFEKGDKVGLIILENGVSIENNNLPYIYDGAEWDYDQETAENEGTGKKLYYNNNSLTDVTYIVYYPYDKNADDATNIGELKSKFIWSANQSTKEAYRNLDLMTWSTQGAPIAKLDVALEHAYPSFSISVDKKYILADGVSTVCRLETEIAGMKFYVGDKAVTPLCAKDGSYRCILEDGFDGNVRWKYTADKEPYANNKDITATANTRYSQVETIDLGEYTKVQNGDFYCVKEDVGYLVPKEASAEFLEDLNCVGIVFYNGNGVSADNYGLLDGKKGLAVSLQDATLAGKAKFTWAYVDDCNVSGWLATSTWAGNITRPSGFTSTTAQDKWQGYVNTLALRQYNEDAAHSASKNKLIEALDEFVAAQSISLPAVTSGWYCPSIRDLKTMSSGQGNEAIYEKEISGKTMLDEQLGKIEGAITLANEDYWSSTEKDGIMALNFLMSSGWFNSNGNKKFSSQYSNCRMRPIFAF